MERLDGQSLDNIHARIEELKRMFPEAVSEGRLDYDLFMALLGDEFDNENEKYQFTWKGKLNSLRLAQKRSSGTLRPDFEESRDFDTTGNLYIEGDNLEVLKLLQQGYLRKVKMIYIDPPYNTGNDFVYEDDFKDPVARYKEVTGQGMRANPETAGRYHSNWLNMMYPRLKIAKTLLRDDGVIFISIDDAEQANLKKMCDEVFGEENFIAALCWRTDGNFDNQAKVKICHEYILMYARNHANFPAPPVIDPSIPQTSKLYRNEIRNTIVKNGPKNPISNATLPIGFPCNLEQGVIVASDIAWPQYSEDIHVRNWVTENQITARSGWSSKSQLEEYIKNGYKPILDSKGQPTRFVISRSGAIETVKSRAENQSHVISVLTDLGGTQKASSMLFDLAPLFNFPKPIELVKYMIQMNMGEDIIILDFFSGSATTAHAVMQLNAEDGGNRKFIMVQIPEPTEPSSEAYKAGYKTIAEIGKERIRRAGDKIKAEAGMLAENLDTGFRVFKLDTSNLVGWDDSYVPQDQLDMLFTRMEQHLNTVKHGRRKIDVVYEIFLKYGIPLTEKLSTLEIDGKTFYAVGENGYLFICLDDNLTVETVEQAAAYAPGTMIFCEECFADNSELTNVGLVLKKAKIELRWI